MARAIEDLGYDSVWLGEHLLYRFADRPPRGPGKPGRCSPAWPRSRPGSNSGRSSPARTSTTRPCSPSRRPRSMRSAAAGSSWASGAGWNRTEFDAFGFPYDHRIDRFEEAFTIIRTLLREGAIDFDGRFYQARDCELLPRGPRPHGPPLMIGSKGPADARHHDALRGLLERLVRRHGQQPGRGRSAARPRGRRRARAPAATRPRSSGRSRSRCGSPAGPVASRATTESARPRLSRARRPGWPTSFEPTPTRGSATSSWCWTRSRVTASRHSHRSSRSSTGAESCVTGTFVPEDRREIAC